MTPKVCKTCNKVHNDLSKLEYIGRQEMPPRFRTVLEMYNCTCGSTLSFKAQVQEDTVKVVVNVMRDKLHNRLLYTKSVEYIKPNIIDYRDLK